MCPLILYPTETLINAHGDPHTLSVVSNSRNRCIRVSWAPLLAGSSTSADYMLHQSAMRADAASGHLLLSVSMEYVLGPIFNLHDPFSKSKGTFQSTSSFLPNQVSWKSGRPSLSSLAIKLFNPRHKLRKGSETSLDIVNAFIMPRAPVICITHGGGKQLTATFTHPPESEC